MDHLIGQRFSLISKSEIRYVGILHEINPEQSTIALEEVFSYGTEDRAKDNFVPPTPQKYEYIVFRGSDVKDIKVAEEVDAPQPPTQQLNDPAILNSSRPGPPPAAQAQQAPLPGPPSNRGESPYPNQNFPPQGYGGYYPPPPPGQFGRGFGPPPGNFGPPGYPYGPPPPGFYGPPGPGRFPPSQPHPPPIGPPGQRQPLPPQQQPPAAQTQPAPLKQTPEMPPVEKSASRNESKPSTPASSIIGPKSTVPSQPSQTEPSTASIPTTTTASHQKQPKSNKIAPAMPMAVNQRSFNPPASTAPQPSAPPAMPAKSQAEMDEASRQAKEAVANALAKLNSAGTAKPAAPTSIDALTEKVSQISTGPGAPRGRGAYRGGRGARTSSGGQKPKMEIPQSDFDFQSSNAKFNKEDLIKEAIASGSPIGETAENQLSGSVEGQLNGTNDAARKNSLPTNLIPAYNKKSSFFDNLSSEAKDREDTQGGFNARTQRGAEFRKNVETFGQGNVDSGYRGRGRGRGYRGRGAFRGQRTRGPSDLPTFQN